MLDVSQLIQNAGEGRQSDIAFDMLRADIVACRIAPGASVSEAQLARRFDLGKAPIRAALARLGERGWLRASPRRGYQVKPVALRDIAEIFELRRVLEPPAVRLAAGRVDADRLAPLNAVCSAGFLVGDAASEATFLQAHRQFHLTIVLATGNRRLARSLEQLWDETERVIHHAGLLRTRASDVQHDHKALVAALTAGDGEAAEAAAMEEVERLHRAIVDTALQTASLLAPAPNPAEEHSDRVHW
jgi:DNA-binding GntR family transcriptional regulator